MKVLYVHIPKNAGNFVTNNFAASFTESETFIVNESTVFVKDFMAAPDEITAHHQFVAGHVPFRLVKPYADRFELIVSSFREPWSRTWSMFRFVTLIHKEWADLRPTGQDDVGAKFETFVDRYFLQNPTTRNHQCGFLGDRATCDAALANVERYRIEMLPCSSLAPALKRVMESHGFPFHEDVHANVTQGQKLSLRPGDRPTVDAKIQDWFKEDYKLYDHFDSALASA